MSAKDKVLKQVGKDPQTAKQIAAAADVNISTARKTLKALADAGAIVKADGKFVAKNVKVTLKASVFAAIAKHGVDKITFDQAFAAAKAVKSDTKFDAKHHAWYKHEFRKAVA